MKNWKYIVLGAAAALSIGFATPASAAHDHYLVTPGTCVPDIARGQTAISDATRGAIISSTTEYTSAFQVRAIQPIQPMVRSRTPTTR